MKEEIEPNCGAHDSNIGGHHGGLGNGITVQSNWEMGGMGGGLGKRIKVQMVIYVAIWVSCCSKVSCVVVTFRCRMCRCMNPLMKDPNLLALQLLPSAFPFVHSAFPFVQCSHHRANLHVQSLIHDTNLCNFIATCATWFTAHLTLSPTMKQGILVHMSLKSAIEGDTWTTKNIQHLGTVVDMFVKQLKKKTVTMAGLVGLLAREFVKKVSVARGL